ncbi:FAD-dependent oxidoreductase [Parashewanella spongiae]|uniref:FAD-dependent oxidoreductase n=1 Tax=Parashewanella spongiae TaxID=342950 RepID=UPI0014052019|nr:FAD-dependent oxidoreductase [Parashewanella spongiae]
MESAQFGLVRESLKERQKLLEIANHLVKPVKFYIPIYKESKRNGWLIILGLSFYYVLSGFSKWGRFKLIPMKNWDEIKGIKKSGLKIILQYWDGQTDDLKLCEQVAHSATILGANIVEGAQCTSIIKQSSGYKLTYALSNDLFEIECSAIINTAGPWANQLLDTVKPKIEPPSINWVQGTHLLLDIPAAEGIVYLESCFDERVIFVMPWYGKTLIGTTETSLTCLPEVIKPTEDEIRYLLGVFVHYFQQYGDINDLRELMIKTFCGVRILPSSKDKAFHTSRETLMHMDQTHPNFLSVFGGKLTTYRLTAKKTVSWLEKQLGKRHKVADFDTITLQDN